MIELQPKDQVNTSYRFVKLADIQIYIDSYNYLLLLQYRYTLISLNTYSRLFGNY